MSDLHEMVEALMASELQLKRELDEMPELGDLPVEMKVRPEPAQVMVWEDDGGTTA